MRRLRVVFPLVCGIFVYCVFSILLGPKSVWSAAQLSSERDKVRANLESLYAVNADLDARVKNLTADPDTIAVYAHELGFVSKGERLIRLAGFSGGIDRKLYAGTPVTVKEPAFLPEWACKLFGISAAVGTALLMSASLRPKKEKALDEPNEPTEEPQEPVKEQEDDNPKERSPLY